jgi:3-oxoacyl-[acyl-carrier protein] reductase
MDLGLAGKTALVAASSEGLGYATAAAFAAEGARVWIGSRDAYKTRSAVERLAASVASKGGARVEGAPLDMTDGASIAAWWRPPLPPTEAGSTPSSSTRAGRLRAVSPTSATMRGERAFDLLLLSAVRLVRAALPGSKRGGVPSSWCPPPP